jgi:exodeoxyribonuclease VII large subunit
MIKVNAEFHELYGFSLNITDIEPSYTIGELARQKLEIIKRLKAEGVFDMNRSLNMPEIPCKIAVISSATAAGYGDFVHQLANNAFGYKFYVKLFPAVMQGEETEQTIIAALDRINRYDYFFDTVVIIRGGGAQSDLHCFNSYWLNVNICQFPLPILTGIGHEQDESVADLVSFRKLKTPTAVAEYLINCMQEVDEEIHERSVNLFNLVTEKVSGEKERLNRMIMQLKPAVKERISDNLNNLHLIGVNLKNTLSRNLQKESSIINTTAIHLQTRSHQYINNEKHKLEMLEKRTRYLDPFLILKRGYSVTYMNGKALKNASVVQPGELIETRLAEGGLKSKTI